MELYHVLNRGVEKRILFETDAEFARFIHGMYVFNDTKSVDNISRSLQTQEPMFELRTRTSDWEPLVAIHGWVLMRNHYHLLLSETVEGGLTRFIRKLNIGYAMYFNLKHERSGTLFQGRTKKILIENEAHFQHILHYLHLNPLDYLDGAQDWREWKIKSAPQALKYLEKYTWSSYGDYCGKKNFPSILTTDLFAEVHGDYKKTIQKYLADSQKEYEERLSLGYLHLE